jgi:SH3 domain protein
MNRSFAIIMSGLVSSILCTAQAADYVYVTSQLRVGLHEEKGTDSAIVKVVPSGTRLELVKRDDAASYVRLSDGTAGWVDNSYLADQAPAAADELNAAHDRESALQQQLDAAKKRVSDLEAAAQAPSTGGAQSSDLEQQLKSERLKNGELQVQVSQLRKRMGQDNSADALQKQIDALQQDKQRLESQLSGSPGAASGLPGWRTAATALGVALLLGLFAGVYLMDYLNRRRHGGFRV